MYDRQGARLHVRTLEMKWDVYASDSTNTIRCMILIDKQGNGVAPTQNDIFELGHTGSYLPQISNVRSRNVQRFRILYD